MKKRLILAAGIAIVCTAIFGLYLYNKPHQSIAGEKPAYMVDATTLVSEFDADETKANSKYLGKIIEVRGIVSEKSRDEKGKLNITLAGADLSGVGCEFDPKFQKQALAVNEGQGVRVKGICTGVLMDVVLVDCVIEN